MSEELTEDNVGEHLNEKQILFCQKYVTSLNGKETYKDVYGIDNDDAAASNASRLLTHDKVAAYLEVLKKERLKRLEITADKVLAQVHNLAFSDIRNLYTDNGRLLAIPELPDELAMAIQSVKVSSRKVPGSGSGEDALYEDITEYKLVDKKSTAEMLLKHLGQLNEKVDLNVQGELKTTHKEMTLEEAARVLQDNLKSLND